MASALLSPQEGQLPGDRTAPKAKLRPEWVYGYRAANCRSNIHLTESGELVYFSAAIGIVQNISESDQIRQRFFLGHDKDIISSCLHPDKTIVATGQIGQKAQICVWNTQGAMKLESLLQGHTVGVGALNFHADGERLASVGIDPENTIKIWQWRLGKMLATVAGHSERVFDIVYRGDKLITCGVKHIRFWTLLGNTLQFKEGQFGKSEAQTLLCIGHFSSSNKQKSTTTPAAPTPGDALCFTGAIDGDLYVWRKNKIDRIIPSAHNSTIYSIDINPNGFLTSSKDGFVKEWTQDFVLTGQTFHIPSLLNENEETNVCSVASHNGFCVAGTRQSEIYGFDLNGRSQPRRLVEGHYDGSLTALACHPRENIFATGGEDDSLRFWNAERTSLITFYSTPFVPFSPPPAIHSLAFSSSGDQIAVGYENGLVEIYPTLLTPHQNDRVKPVHSMHDRTDRIQSLAFSHNNKYLAVGCVDGNLDVYETKENFRNLHFKNDGNALSVLNIDWTEDESYVRYTGETKQLFVVKVPSFEKVQDTRVNANQHWATHTCLKGPLVEGIWNKFAEKTDILTIDAHDSIGVIAAGDAEGRIKLFRFPSEKRGAHFCKYAGHSSQISNVCFLHDTSRLITIGTDDHTIIQWRFYPESDSIAIVDARRMSMAASVAGDTMAGPDMVDTAIEDAQMLETAQQVGTYLDSDSEDSDSDLSGVEIDSDIEKEKQISYDRAVYREDYQKVKKTVKKELKPGEKRKKEPDGGLTLDYVFGYRGYDCRDNVFCLKNGEIVYHVAALGIVLHADQKQQRFYNCHTDDILCLCVSPDMSLVATGQIGRDPPVHVWDPESMQTAAILKGQHFRGISALGFSKDGKSLASVGLDDNRTIVIWNWKKGEKISSQRGHNDKIFCLRWNPLDNDRFVTVGVKHIKFWTRVGGGMTGKQGVFGKVGGKQGKENQMCLVFGKTADVCITGGGDGCIYIWIQTALSRKVDHAHEGPVFAITAVQDKGYATGGKDGKVILWDPDFKKSIKTYELTNKNLASDSRGVLTEEPCAVRAVTLTRRIVVGTKGGEICEIEKDGRIRVPVQGHGEGEMWGVSTHPKKYEICTVSDDKTVRIWSIQDRRMLRFKTKSKPLRTCEYSQDGRYIAVGTKDGQFIILNETDLSELASVQHRHQEVSDIKFSPNDRYLAVGTHDNFVDIYNVEGQKRVGICKANSSYITHIDWNANGKLIMTNSGAKEQLFYEAPRGTRVTSVKTTDIETMNWSTWTGVLGLVCEGIWPPATDITDVNSTDLSKDKKILATADDFGLVKLFDFPVKGRFAKFKRYTGHSAHVTRVRWTFNDSYLISIGGRDVATIVWKHERAISDTVPEVAPVAASADGQVRVRSLAAAAPPTAAATTAGVTRGQRLRGESDDSDNTDSEEEGYDSDVQHDRNMDYNARILIDPVRSKVDKKELRRPTATNQKPIRLKIKSAPIKSSDDLALMKIALKSSIGLGLLSAAQKATTDAPPEDEGKPRGRIAELRLDHIHGYRGFDCRDNLFYLADNESIVYPAAGAGVVHHVARGTQQFYLAHTDDIISMAVHNGSESGNIVATGQIGENPTIHVWNAQTRRTLSVLSGRHKRGVCSLSFSSSGKLLLSVGVDAPYTIAVWRWKEGINVACAVASEDRIFRALFRPKSDTQFVSVGVKHLKFWAVAGNTLVDKKVIMPKTIGGKRTAKMQTMLSIAFDQEERTYTGSMTGAIFIWRFNTLERVVEDAHTGPIFSMFTSDKCIVTGAKEKRSRNANKQMNPVKIWDFDMTNGRPVKLELPPADSVCVRSVCLSPQGKVLIGLKTSDIVEIDDRSSSSQPMSLVFGHGEGPLWGLSPHPKEQMFATGSYDRNLVVWNISTRDPFKYGGLVVKRDMGKEVRSVSFDREGTQLGVGFKDGQVSLISFNAERKELNDVAKARERNAVITCVRFSPNRKLLAASSENCCIDFFDIQQNKLTRVGYVTHIQDFVTQMDWSTNSQYIRAGTASYHALIFRVPTGEEVNNGDEIEKLVWDTWTSTIGADVVGIWPKDAKKDHINCATATSSTIVTGDDNGAVKLFKFPCPELETEHKTYYGHSDNITNVRFLANENYLVSLGGDDCCIFLWKCIPETLGQEDD